MLESHPVSSVPTIDSAYEKMVNNNWRASWRLNVFMVAYRLLWRMLLPVALLYLYRKGRKEPLYRRYIAERFGGGQSTLTPTLMPFSAESTAKNNNSKHRVWLHAASLGELRGIAPLIQALLNQGHTVVLSTLTPAGRMGAQSLFQAALHNNTLQVVYTPLEIVSAVKRFIALHRPNYALMAEIDTWPVLVTTIKRCGLPLAFVNAQYPKKSFERDVRWWGIRSELFAAYDQVLCKSTTHAQRFQAVACRNVHVVGETRFDLPIAPHLLSQADAFLQYSGLLQAQRPIICIASAVAAEEPLFIQAIQGVNMQRQSLGLPLPFWVIVPRSPQRFEVFFEQLNCSSRTHRVHRTNRPSQFISNADEQTSPTLKHLHFVRRSVELDAQLKLVSTDKTWADIDGLLGDSLGEMYFYLQLSQMAVVGASFVPLGSHNVIEPLALKKPVLVGPSIWGIEYPGVEAMALGVLTQCSGIGGKLDTNSTNDSNDINDIKGTNQAFDSDSLIKKILQFIGDKTAYAQAMQGCEAFYQAHCGATQRHLEVLQTWFEQRANGFVKR
jgi:3-deoxy-D-manno-octulosonic-acid transferase